VHPTGQLELCELRSELVNNGGWPKVTKQLMLKVTELLVSSNNSGWSVVSRCDCLLFQHKFYVAAPSLLFLLGQFSVE